MERTEPGVDLGTSLGYLLKQAASALRGAIDEALRPLELTITQYSSLELLAQRPGLSGSDLARGTFVTRQSMQVVLQGLEQLGLVQRPEAAPVGRVLPAELTPLGRQRLGEASVAVRAVEDRMRSDLDVGEGERLMDLLRRCVAGLQR